MKWYALFLLLAGIAALVWSVTQETSAALDNLPVVVLAGLAGVVAMIVAAVIWFAIILFAGA